MEQRYSLAHMSAQTLPPPALVAMAARAGYDHVGLRLLAPAPGIAAYPLMDDPTALRATREALRATGLQVWDIEIVRLQPDFRVSAFLPFLETGAELGARAVLVVAGDDPEAQRLADSFAAFCDAARPLGLTANLEFTPWTRVPDALSALSLWKAAGRPQNAGVLVDAIHVERSATTLTDLQYLPRELLHYSQFCDAPRGIPASMEEVLRQARFERMLPGEGGIDLAGLLRVLPAGLLIAVEVWDAVRAPAMGLETWARTGLEAMQSLVAQARGAPAASHPRS